MNILLPDTMLGTMHPARIVLIDDSEVDVTLFRYGLEQQNEEYDLEILSDGEAALRFVSEHRSGVREPNPCAILLDLYLPFFDGLAVLRAIRQAPALEHIHVVVLTGLASPRQQLEIAELGALYRRKSSSLDDICKLAAEVLDLCKSSSKTAA
jgi:CheY-like chemotaxis protein